MPPAERAAPAEESAAAAWQWQLLWRLADGQTWQHLVPAPAASTSYECHLCSLPAASTSAANTPKRRWLCAFVQSDTAEGSLGDPNDSLPHHSEYWYQALTKAGGHHKSSRCASARREGARWPPHEGVQCCVHHSSVTSREDMQGAMASPPPEWSAALAAAAACAP